MIFSKEYLHGIIERSNKIEDLGEQWEFVKKAIELEQGSIVMAWLTGNLDSDTAKARIHAFKWLLDFISGTARQYPLAKKELEKTT